MIVGGGGRKVPAGETDLIQRFTSLGIDKIGGTKNNQEFLQSMNR